MKPFMQIFLKPFADLSVGQVSPNAQCLYLRLFMINNRLGWDKETFQSTIQRLLLETGISSKNTLIRARDELIEAGFIEYTPGKDKKPSTYRLIPLGTEYESNISGSKFEPKTGNKTDKETGNKKRYSSISGSKFEPKTDKETGNETGRIIDNNIHKDKDPKKAAAASCGCVREGNFPNYENEKRTIGLPYAQVTELYNTNIHRITGDIEQNALNDLVDTYGAEWCLAAIEVAAKANGRTVRYLESILARWKREGFKSQLSQANFYQNSQIVPLPARRMPPQPAQRKLLGIDGLRAMWEAEKK